MKNENFKHSFDSKNYLIHLQDDRFEKGRTFLLYGVYFSLRVNGFHAFVQIVP